MSRGRDRVRHRREADRAAARRPGLPRPVPPQPGGRRAARRGWTSLADEMRSARARRCTRWTCASRARSLAGVLMAAAMEGMGLYEFSRHVVPQIEDLSGSIGDVLSRVNMPALPGGGSLAGAPPPSAAPLPETEPPRAVAPAAAGRRRSRRRRGRRPTRRRPPRGARGGGQERAGGAERRRTEGARRAAATRRPAATAEAGATTAVSPGGARGPRPRRTPAPRAERAAEGEPKPAAGGPSWRRSPARGSGAARPPPRRRPRARGGGAGRARAAPIDRVRPGGTRRQARGLKAAMLENTKIELRRRRRRGHQGRQDRPAAHGC